MDNSGAQGQEVMHPPLVLRAYKGGLSIWALGRDERPTETTTLCRAPYFNVYDRGNMCVGSVRLPEEPRPDNVPAWEECFFGSNFGHGNSQSITRHPKGHTGYWTDLAKGNATKTYAMKWLVPLPLTLKGVVQGSLINE